jgi:hypothetical protein
MRKLLPYIILNIIISAATILVVLTVWQKAQQNALKRDLPQNTATPARVESLATLPPLEMNTVAIEGVIGAGDIQNERIKLVSISDEVVDLSGWELTDGNGRYFFFPAVKLYPGGSINLYSRSGTDTAIELYWKQPLSIWASGDVVELNDPDGNTRAEFRIP